MGDLVGARRSLTDAILVEPGFAGAELTRAPELTAVWIPAVDDALKSLAPALAFDAALSSNQLARANRYASQVAEPATHSLLDLVEKGWSGDRIAFDDLRSQAIAQPLNPTILKWAARVADHLGDPSADQFRTLLEDNSAQSSAGTYPLEIRTGPDADGVIGVNSEFYGHFTYRRPTPWNQLVKTLPHLDFR
jgi:hypothetical protein